MRPTGQAAVFTEDPVGRVLIGPCWLYFCAHPELYGFVMWGTPDRDAVEALVRALRVELRDDAVPHRSLVDVSRIEGVDAGAFEALSAYVVAETEALSARVTRLALVRPPGFAGAVAAGFYQVLDRRPYPVEVVDDAAAGLRGLGEDPALAEELGGLVLEATETSALVVRLPAWRSARLRNAELGAAARALAVSERTLQRRLREVGTTFGAELTRARVGEVRRRLRETDDPIGDIAFETGFSSSQHLSRAFKKEVGQTPSAWRAGAAG